MRRAKRTAGSVLLILATAACSGGSSSGGSGSAMLISLDTTRFDACSPYGAPDVVTPHLSALAEEGIVYESAYTVAPITLPAHASMLTGLYPPRHGIRDNGIWALPRSADTIAELAADSGRKTAAFIAAIVLDIGFGLDQGFDLYDVPPRPIGQDSNTIPERTGEQMAERVNRWLDELGEEDEFFTWVHLWDPHAPYTPIARHQEVTPGNPYSAEVFAVDEAIGMIVAKLRELGRMDDTFIAVVADHGEAFGEHREYTHAVYCFETTLKVPFVLRYPDGHRAGTRSKETVSVVDLYPTLLDAMGLSIPSVDGDLDGQSLYHNLIPEDRGIYFESYYGYLSFGWSPITGWLDRDGKYIHNSLPRLFDIRSQPNEMMDMSKVLTDTVDHHLARIEETLAAPRLPRDDDAGIDADLRSSVEALGYAAFADPDADLPGPRDLEGMLPPQMRTSELNLIHQANNLVQKGQLEQAYEMYQTVVDSNPANHLARERMALCLIRQGRFAEAVGPLKQVLAGGMQRPNTWYYLGLSLLEIEQKEEAIIALKTCLDIEETHSHALAALVHLLDEKGASEEAQPYKDQLIRIRSRR